MEFGAKLKLGRSRLGAQPLPSATVLGCYQSKRRPRVVSASNASKWMQRLPAALSETDVRHGDGLDARSHAHLDRAVIPDRRERHLIRAASLQLSCSTPARRARTAPSRAKLDFVRSLGNRRPGQVVSPEGSCGGRRQAPSWTSEVGCGALASNSMRHAFRENEIDDTVLPSLTAEDLKDLGVGIVGHRRKLLDAIAALRAEASATPPPHAVRRRPYRQGHRRAPPGHRDVLRTLSVRRRSPPAWTRRTCARSFRPIRSASPRPCAASAGSWRRYMGDGVLVYFGYPQAHEDDAERAVRAGLELIAAVAGAQDAASAANPGRHRHRAGRGRRPDRIGRGAGARHRRRDAEPCGAPARRSPSRTWSSSPKAREGFSAISSSCEDLGPKEPQGHRRAGAGLGGAAGEFGGKPLRGAARDRPDRPGRAGRRTRIAAAALVEGKDRRRPGGAALRRGRHRQIAAHGRAPGTPRRPSRTRACAISARRSTPTARFIRSSARWNAPPDWRTTTHRKRSSTSSMRCSRRPRPRRRTRHSLPRCCRSRTMDAIPRSI